MRTDTTRRSATSWRDAPAATSSATSRSRPLSSGRSAASPSIGVRRLSVSAASAPARRRAWDAVRSSSERRATSDQVSRASSRKPISR